MTSSLTCHQNSKIVEVHPWHKTNLYKLKHDILSSLLWSSAEQAANELALQVQSALSELLDRQITFRTIMGPNLSRTENEECNLGQF